MITHTDQSFLWWKQFVTEVIYVRGSASQIERFFKFGHETVLRSSQGIRQGFSVSGLDKNTFFGVNS